MTELLQTLADKIKDAHRRILMVSDPDGLLTEESVCKELSRYIGFDFRHCEGLGLRVDFELNVRRNPDAKICYVMPTDTAILPDITILASRVRIDLAELFPNFTDREVLRRLSFDELSMLYAKHLQGRIDAKRLQQLLSVSPVVAEPVVKTDIEVLREIVEGPDWSDFEVVTSISRALKGIFAKREYTKEVAEIMRNLNFDFQHYLRDSYFATLNSSGLEPRTVRMVIPFLQQHFSPDEKVCLVVIDGMAWWQWEVLRDQLDLLKSLSSPKVTAMLSWLPSITALSRQALFRGAEPLSDYKQSPAEEEKLWRHQWKSNPIFSPVYQHNVGTPDELATYARRLAIVDVALDKKMHQSSDYYDLHDLTRNWAVKFAEIIGRLHNEGFRIVITTDHGNVMAHGIGTLKPQDKVHLYLNNSRGERFVYFNSPDLQRSFAESNYLIPYFRDPNDGWLAIADDSSFSTKNKQLITHGGSHFLETIIPLIVY